MAEDNKTEHSKIEKQIEELMRTRGFGAVISPITPVSGGFLHRMYRVETQGGVYAVKHLNPEIMGRVGVLDNYARAERIECILEREGIPIVPAVTAGGRKMQRVEESFFYLFRWQEGGMTDWGHITEEQCRAAGEILGRIHGIDPGDVSPQEPERCEIGWRAYLARAEEENGEIASLLADNEALLESAVEELNRARASLPAIVRISNEDMDPKNVMWDHGSPRVIDLECLDYGNPISHALQLSLQWAGAVTCSLDRGKLEAFFDGYLGAYDNGFRAYHSVYGLAYTWVEWLEYNVRRALGMEGPGEREMGLSEAVKTVGRIRYLRGMEEEIKEILSLSGRVPYRPFKNASYL